MGWQWHQLDHYANHLHLTSDRLPRQYPTTQWSLWWERFVKEVGLEPGVKERERELRMVITSIVGRRYDGVGMLLAAGEWTESKRDDTGISDVDR